MTLYDGQTWEERGERILKRRAEDKESVELMQPVVTGLRVYGKPHVLVDVDIEFTLNGERVWGSFLLTGWRQPPSELARECDEALRSNPPRAVYGKLKPPRRPQE